MISTLVCEHFCKARSFNLPHVSLVDIVDVDSSATVIPYIASSILSISCDQEHVLLWSLRGCFLELLVPVIFDLRK